MGQAEIFELMKKNPDKEFTYKDIAEEFNIAPETAIRNLNRLVKDPFIERKKTDGKFSRGSVYIYRSQE